MNRKEVTVFLMVAIFAVVIALFVSGCGGGGTETNTGANENQQGSNTQQTTQQTTVSATTPLAEPITLPKKFEVDRTTPEFFKEALEKKRPLVVFFYSEEDTVSDMVRESIKNIAEKPQYSDVIFLALNIKKPEHVFGLIKPLGVTYTPFVAVIDDTGTIVKEFSGYVDEKVLEQAVYDVVKGQTTVTTETSSK